jgi:hypothetical protein
MKATIEHVQTAPIPENIAQRAVSIAGDAAHLAAVQAQGKAAREFLRGLYAADEEWQQAQALKKDIRNNTTATREEIKALEASAKERAGLAHPDVQKTLETARLRSGSLRKRIEGKIADSGQLFLAFGEG